MHAGLGRLVVAVFAVVAAMAVTAPTAGAKTEDIIADSKPPHTANSGWQAGTCKSEPPEPGAAVCSIDTPEQFYETAAGRPVWGFTQFIVRSEPAPLPPMGLEPIDDLQQVMVDLPQGLSVNPQATPQCELSDFEGLGCPANTKVGESLVTGAAPLTGVHEQLPPADVYNVVPKEGQPALFAFKLGTEKIFIEAFVAWEGDYHEGFYIDVPEIPVLGSLAGGLVYKQRLRFKGRSGDGTYITTPTTCFDWENEAQYKTIYSTYLRASGVKEEEENPGYEFPADAEPAIESPLPEGKKPLDCPGIPYDPTTGIEPNTAQTNSPAGALTEIKVPHIVPAVPSEDSRSNSMTKQVQVSLPAGMGLNPSAANGLVACTDAQFGKGTRNPVGCPPASRIGAIEIETPPLPDGSIIGDVYVGEQKSRDPASGEEYRILVNAVARDPEDGRDFGVTVRLIGNVSADPVTGQLTTRFGGLPQVPFSSVELKINEGPRSALTSPSTCGPHVLTTTMTPWSGNPDEAPTDGFTLTEAPGGGACAKTLGERPFVPGFAGATSNPQGGAFTDLSLDVARSPGNQELKGVEVTLPHGLTAKLAGLVYCPEAAISTAGGRAGAEEAASASCPSNSLVGSAVITSGSGPEPLKIEGGKAFLSGPYNGAPLSLAVITPATAGPFDLGTVVVRVALFVDSKTAQVRAVSDPLPHVYGGALLDVRTVSVKMDRPEFALNPTSCAAQAFAGVLRGGGADPTDPAAFTSVAASSPFQPQNCDKLGFKPRLTLRAFGATKRTKNPKLRATVRPRPGDANIARAAVTLPPALILDQASISKVCTRVQFAARQCPSNSIYGFAEATTPLLDGPLKGPVYLRSSDNTLPDLVAALDGQVSFELSGRTDTVKGRIRNTFDMVPDVPVSKFVLTIRGGKKKGLLVNSRGLCARKWFSRVDMSGHNGKRMLKKKLRLQVKCKKRKKKR